MMGSGNNKGEGEELREEDSFMYQILDYGSLPFWEEDGLQLVQSFAIARHLARKYGMKR